MSELLQLSFQTQVMLVSGYISYSLAYSGWRQNHSHFDTSFIILCFGSIYLAINLLIKSLVESDHFSVEIISSLVGITSTVIAAVLWRNYFRIFSFKIFRKVMKGVDDNLISAFDSVINDVSLSHSELFVSLNNGTCYESYPLGQFNDLPNGPCTYGRDGSIAMYITRIFDEHSPEGRHAKGTINEDGHRITIIPADQIREIEIRRR
ncbi:hypothetical protein [Marivivens aquimaris]|uniref:hypothetical protein n=1 Tax=Marivivens aquimaris TaxID=2774876 RepID=UPI0018817CB3|nr:hypothetical protein [Marivivens aquimaris]